MKFKLRTSLIMFFSSFLLSQRPWCDLGFWWLLVILWSEDGGRLSWWVLEGILMLVYAILKFRDLGHSVRGVSLLGSKAPCAILIWWHVLFESLWSKWEVATILFWLINILQWRLEVAVAEWRTCTILRCHRLKASLFNKYLLLQTLDLFRELEIFRIQFVILGSLSFKFLL